MCPTTSPLAGQWDRIDSPEINLYICGQLIFQQGCQENSLGKELSSQQMVLIELGSYMQRAKLCSSNSN